MQTAKRRGMQKFQKEMSKKSKNSSTSALQKVQTNPPVKKEEQMMKALAPVHYQKFNKIFEDDHEEIESEYSKQRSRDVALPVEQTRNMEIHDESFDTSNQITVYDEEKIEIEESEQQIKSQSQ